MPSFLLRLKPAQIFGSIVVLSIILHWNIWDLDIMGIHAWRQTQTMTVVENFATEDMNILNPRINSRGDGDGIFRMEFPLMQWGFAWFYKLLGDHLIIARILSFLISLASIIGFYKLLETWNLKPGVASMGAWCFAWSPVLFYYSLNPLPDNLALSCAIWSMVYLKKYQATSSISSFIRFACFLSIATAVKLPFIVFGAGFIPIFFFETSKSNFRQKLTHSAIAFVFVLPALIWYGWVIPQWKNMALIGGIGAESTFDFVSAASTLWGTFHSLLPELFVNYGSILFFLLGISAFLKQNSKWIKFKVELSILLFVFAYYLYEVNMIGLVHDYYLFPFVPFIFLVVAAGINQVLKYNKSWLSTLGTIAILILPITAYLRTTERWSPMGVDKQMLPVKEELRRLTPNDELVVVGNDPSTHIMLYHINKKGWTFEKDWLIADSLNQYVERGAKYLYSNTDLIEETASLKQFTSEPIFNKNGITVYPLKPLSDP